MQGICENKVEDSPALNCAYKLQEHAGRPCFKTRVRDQLKQLPNRLRSLDHAIDYSVRQSTGLIHLIERLTADQSKTNAAEQNPLLACSA